MKLYAFQPNNVGNDSFFVMSESEEKAIKAIKKLKKTNSFYRRYGLEGFPDDYELEVADIDEVITNDND